MVIEGAIGVDDLLLCRFHLPSKKRFEAANLLSNNKKLTESRRRSLWSLTTISSYSVSTLRFNSLHDTQPGRRKEYLPDALQHEPAQMFVADTSNKRKAEEIQEIEEVEFVEFGNRRDSQAARMERKLEAPSGEKAETASLTKELSQLTAAVTQLAATNKDLHDQVQRLSNDQIKEMKGLKDSIRELKETVASLKKHQGAAQGNTKVGESGIAPVVPIGDSFSFFDLKWAISALLRNLAEEKNGRASEKAMQLQMLQYGSYKPTDGFTFSEILQEAEGRGYIERSANGYITLKTE
ncbi:hypothetical protein QFC21_000178 [Naganishia friedmannii]|uniref:Uncharacterized protein n=1 Tax=Naganishia friedmannii TaxID=89922 RepID=A0ACC2WBV1_9TREE|nr:hypothetical protein QFC21_000178 [Naganishia friedmannii]